MKRRAIIGLAPIAVLLAGCGDRANLDNVAAAKANPTTPVTTPVTLGADVDLLIVDRLWEQMGGDVCQALDEAIDLNVLTRDEVIDYAISQTDTANISDAQISRMRQLIDRDC